MRSLALIRENGDLGTEMGTQKLKKVPMGTGSLKWGPTWEQCQSSCHGRLTIDRVENKVDLDRMISALFRSQMEVGGAAQLI